MLLIYGTDSIELNLLFIESSRKIRNFNPFSAKPIFGRKKKKIKVFFFRNFIARLL